MKSDAQNIRVYNEIRKKILMNLLTPNTRLVEDTWAKKLDVSRLAVREALNRLLGERLVMLGEKGGYFVTAVTAKDIEQIKELRQILEVGALRLCAKKMNAASLSRLQKICDDFTTMYKQGYFSGAMEADMKFHDALIDIADNEKLYQAYHTSHIVLFHLKLGKTQTYLNDFAQTDTEHRKILGYLKTKKTELAEDALIDHLARGAAAVLELD